MVISQRLSTWCLHSAAPPRRRSIGTTIVLIPSTQTHYPKTDFASPLVNRTPENQAIEWYASMLQVSCITPVRNWSHDLSYWRLALYPHNHPIRPCEMPFQLVAVCQAPPLIYQSSYIWLPAHVQKNRLPIHYWCWQAIYKPVLGRCLSHKYWWALVLPKAA